MLNQLGQQNNNFFINSKIYFNPISNISISDIKTCFNFAYSMTFGKGGEHRAHRSGGNHKRRNGELFINAFQGKATEFGFYRYLEVNEINCPAPDTFTYELGKWDSYDLLVNNSKINIKSTKFYGNLLLLETRDWNEQAQYIPNIGLGDTAEYDFFVFMRIRPDGEKIMRMKRLLYTDSINKIELEKLILNQKWDYDIPGYVTREDLKSVIEKHMILPQKAMLNGKIKMDAENYYVQAGDMSHVSKLLRLLQI